MARGTDFGGVHSSRDLRLIQQRADVQPAEPKFNFVDVPGADGSKDLSDQPAGRVVFKARTLSWTFALYPGDRWHDRHRIVSGALNGRACKITLDDDPGYYYQGRLAVKGYKVDQTLRQITVEATCQPYKFKQAATVTEAALTTTAKRITLKNDRKPAVPTFTTDAAAVITWAGNSYTIAPGTHTILDIELQEGDNVLTVAASSGTGTLTITYQEGAL